MPRPNGPQFNDGDNEVRQRSETINRLTSLGFPLRNIHIDEDGEAAVHYRIGDWVAKYHGYQVDVAHASNPNKSLDMINVYDYEKGKHQNLKPSDLHQHLQDWIEDVGQDYMRNKRDM